MQSIVDFRSFMTTKVGTCFCWLASNGEEFDPAAKIDAVGSQSFKVNFHNSKKVFEFGGISYWGFRREDGFLLATKYDHKRRVVFTMKIPDSHDE